MTIIERSPCTLGAAADQASGRRLEESIEINLGATASEHRQRHEPSIERPPRGTAGRRPVTDSPPDSSRIGDVLIEGLGVIPAAVLTQLCQTLGTNLTRALVDTETGVTVETSDLTYRPGARSQRFVVTRDQHCRFPGCTRPARLDDVDHVVRWPDGETIASNLQCLCRHHHRAKHEGGWRVSMMPEGICTWTSPSGRHYVTRPAD